MSRLRALMAWLLRPFATTATGFVVPFVVVAVLLAGLLFFTAWNVVVLGNPFNSLEYGGAAAAITGIGGGGLAAGAGVMIRSRAAAQRDQNLEGM